MFNLVKVGKNGLRSYFITDWDVSNDDLPKGWSVLSSGHLFTHRTLHTFEPTMRIFFVEYSELVYQCIPGFTMLAVADGGFSPKKIESLMRKFPEDEKSVYRETAEAHIKQEILGGLRW